MGDKHNHNTSISKRITWVVLLVLMCMAGCIRRDVRLRADAIVDRAAMAVLVAHDVNTTISDSGIIRYRIKAPIWNIYDKADTPYWEFPNGIYLEKFNTNLDADATVEPDLTFVFVDTEYSIGCHKAKRLIV